MASVILDPSDLKPEFQTGEGDGIDQAISTFQVTFQKLNEKAQRLVEINGHGTFFSWDRQTYNPISPSK